MVSNPTATAVMDHLEGMGASAVVFEHVQNGKPRVLCEFNGKSWEFIVPNHGGSGDRRTIKNIISDINHRLGTVKTERVINERQVKVPRKRQPGVPAVTTVLPTMNPVVLPDWHDTLKVVGAKIDPKNFIEDGFYWVQDEKLQWAIAEREFPDWLVPGRDYAVEPRAIGPRVYPPGLTPIEEKDRPVQQTQFDLQPPEHEPEELQPEPVPVQEIEAASVAMNDDSRTKEAVGQRMRQMRLRLGYKTCTSFAEAACVPITTYWGNETGRALPTPKAMEMYAMAYGCTKEWLAAGIGESAEEAVAAE